MSLPVGFTVVIESFEGSLTVNYVRREGGREEINKKKRIQILKRIQMLI
jgi:hypothetical protein